MEGATKPLASLSRKLTPSVFVRYSKYTAFFFGYTGFDNRTVRYVCAVPPQSSTKDLDEDLKKWVECGNTKAKHTAKYLIPDRPVASTRSAKTHCGCLRRAGASFILRL